MKKKYKKGDIIDTEDYPKTIEYDCGCIYTIEDIKGQGQFSVYPDNFCEEHDPTIYHEKS